MNCTVYSSLLETHLCGLLHGADIRVWTEKNVLQLGLLLIHSLHRQLGGRLVFLGPFHLAGISSAVRCLLFNRVVLVITGLMTLVKLRALWENTVLLTPHYQCLPPQGGGLVLPLASQWYWWQIEEAENWTLDCKWTVEDYQFHSEVHLQSLPLT